MTLWHAFPAIILIIYLLDLNVSQMGSSLSNNFELIKAFPETSSTIGSILQSPASIIDQDEPLTLNLLHPLRPIHQASE